MNGEPLLRVSNLHVEFSTHGGVVQAVRGVNFSVDANRTLAIVGESGCGKSVSVQSIMGLIPIPPGRVSAGSARLRGEEILGGNLIDGRDVRGSEIGMIFQDPMTSLNPTMTIGAQIAEPLRVHRGYGAGRARKEAIRLLESCRIPEARKRAGQYPFEFSGGMLQRAMIAMAISCKPALLIADEPTTALDVTIQSQILDLMRELQRETGMAIILITHDLGVVARMANEVAVMYRGQDRRARLGRRYFLSLGASIHLRPAFGDAGQRPFAAGRTETDRKGVRSDLFAPPPGCGYAPRCPHAMKLCEREHPPEFTIGPGPPPTVSSPLQPLLAASRAIPPTPAGTAFRLFHSHSPFHSPSHSPSGGVKIARRFWWGTDINNRGHPPVKQFAPPTPPLGESKSHSDFGGGQTSKTGDTYP